MICTEKEASKKWCPHARVIEYAPPAGDGDPEASPPSNRTILSDEKSGDWVSVEDAPCVGSACMSWRWAEDRVLRSYNSSETRPVVIGQTFDGSKWFMDESPSATHGYCGLAGKP